MAKKNAECATEIGAGTRIKGRLTAAEDLLLAGRLEGSLHTEGALTISEGGVVKAEVHARRIVVAGTVVGNLHASEQVELRPSARVLGDIQSPRLTVAEGARFAGALEIGDVERAVSAPERRTEARLISLPLRREDEPGPTARSEELAVPLYGQLGGDHRGRRVVVKRR